jgi:hypothetical protein
MIASLVLVIGAFVSVRVIARQLETAPEGFEDATGFHVVRRAVTSRVRRSVRRKAIFTAGRHSPAAILPRRNEPQVRVSVG